MHYLCRRLVRLSSVLFLFSAFPSTTLANDRDLVKKMQTGNAVVMVRHALAPGIGDPKNFKLEDCATQRNLNEAGREQARSMGQWLRHRGIEQVKLYSSQWCRCLETARLMKMGPVIPLAPLNSFFQHPENREPSLLALRRFISESVHRPVIPEMVT